MENLGRTVWDPANAPEHTRPRVTNAGELGELYRTDPEYANEIAEIARVFGDVPFSVCQEAVDLIRSKHPRETEKANLDKVVQEVAHLLKMGNGNVDAATAFIRKFEGVDLV